MKRHHDRHSHGERHPYDSEKAEPRGPASRIKGRYREIIYGNLTLVGLLSLAWLVIRSGFKPSRLRYPCQRAALANTAFLLGGAAVPVAARLPRVLLRGSERPRLKRALRFAEAAVAVTLVLLLVLTLTGVIGGGARSMEEIRAAAAALMLPSWRAGAADNSSIFVAEHIPAQSEKGVDSLVDIMGANGLDFYKGESDSRATGPSGLIGSNDVVCIKVNGEWRQRGGTNTDVVKGLVQAIVNHPEGFGGEVVIVENGQWDTYMDNLPNNQNPDQCNAEDRTQSFNDVALMFAQDHRVSVYDWTQVQNDSVAEFADGDARDGYVYVPEIEEGYPKWTTVCGTHVSLRYGVWENGGYDNSRLKFINVPVLKDHGGPGVTCSIKHFMGVQDLWQNTQNAPHGPMVSEGIFGKVMLVARFPDLNIADAIWVTPSGGPNGPYDSAVRLDRLVASQDPVALDYYCGKYVLMPVSGNSRHDPNSPDQFNQMLTSTMNVLVGGGRQATMDENRMNVFKSAAPDDPPVTPYEYLLAEGCTSYGFETFTLIANPNDAPANVYVSYYTEEGCRNRAPLVVPAKSRLTVKANDDIWPTSAGIRVGSDLPVCVERAMYWNDRTEGHDSIGASQGSKTWYLAEGCTAYGFETWIEILNPGTADANATVTYNTPSGVVAGPTVTVPPRSRRTVKVSESVPSDDASALVTSDNPVVVERAMYWDGRRGGHGSIGVTAPAKDWYLAEGATHSGYDTYVLVQNPGTVPANVTLEMTTTEVPGGKAGSRTFEFPLQAGTRRTLKLNDIVPGCDVATHVTSDAPVVAERSMFWPVEAGLRAGHDTTGLTAGALETFLPEGCTDLGFDTWVLVWNQGAEPSSVAVYAMTEGGERKVAEFTLDPGTRRSVRMGDYLTGSFSTRVQATGPVVCERSVYWNNRGGGTCSIGITQ